MKSRLFTTSAFLVGALSVPVGMAQGQETGSEQPDSRRLDTITVSATKREQTLQDVPVAVSVVDTATIEKAEILDLGDLQSIVPSLRVGQLQSTANTNFIIRGFGNGANNAGIEPSVGVFIDGVYRSRSAAQVQDLPKLKRVEVLKGPQSTLFGKNASAGVISIVTESPQQEFGGQAEVSYGNFDQIRAKGYFTGPISDKLAFSIGGNVNKRDGFADDLALDRDINDRDRWGIRGQLLYEPTSNMSFRVIADYDEIDEICCVAANLVNGPTGDIVFALGGAIDPEAPFSFDAFNNFESTNEIENSGISLQSDFGFDFFDVVSITAYRTSDAATNQDSDFTSADLIGRNANDTQIDTFTQELRISSNTDGRFDWMVGGFYFDEEVDIDNQILYGDDIRNFAELLALQAGGAPGTPGELLAGLNAGVVPSPLGDLEAALGIPNNTLMQGGQGLTEQFGQDNTAFSIFTTVDLHLTDRITLTGGLNYTEDEKDAFGQVNSTDVLSSLDLVELGFGQALAGAGVDPTDPVAVGTFAATNPAAFAAIQEAAVDPASNPLLGLQALQFFPPFLDFPNSVEDGETNDDKLTYVARAAFDVNDNIKTYVSAATGFKASSWNLSRDSRPFPSDFTPGSPVTSPPASPIRDAGLAVANLTTGSRFAGPEEATVYEIGLKAAFERLAVNVALFDQEIEGFQSNVFTGTGFALANAGKQSVQGGEIDLTWQPVDPLTLVFAGTFLDPQFDSFVASAGGDISGTTPSGIPDVALSTSATYTFDLGQWNGFARGDWQYESESDFFDAVNPDSGAADLQALLGDEKEINTFNGSIGLESPNGYEIVLWGRNLFDDEYVTTAFPSVAQDGSISGYPNPPRTYGVTLRKRF